MGSSVTRQDASHSDSGRRSCGSDSVTNNSSYKRDSVTRNAASSGNAECGPNLGMETGGHSLPVTHHPGDSLSVTHHPRDSLFVTHHPEDSLPVTHCSGDSLSVTHSNDGGGKSLKEGNRDSDADAGTRIKTYLRQLSSSETSVLGQIVRWVGEDQCGPVTAWGILTFLRREEVTITCDT